MASITIDIDLDEIDTYDVLDELEGRLEMGRSTKTIVTWIEKQYTEIQEKKNTLFENEKIAFFNEHLEKITLEDLESIVNNK
ncbi:hypothetical protein [Capnocytophaga canis]|uniref:hypothetical protein n=1 Tax=Capnocytophaga canis TaxID=1848903 RepID=UPI0037D75183